MRSGGRVRPAEKRSGQVARVRERLVEATAALRQVPADIPEAAQRDGEAQVRDPVPGDAEVVERGAEVVVLGLERREPA